MSHARARSYTSCTTYRARSRPPSLPLLRSAWTAALARERERRVGRSVLRSAEFSFSSFLHSLSRFSGIESRAAPAHALPPPPSFCFYSSLSLSTAPFLPPFLPRISPVTSLPFSLPSFPHSIHDEIRSARNIANSSQNATVTPFSAVKEEEEHRRQRTE